MPENDLRSNVADDKYKQFLEQIEIEAAAMDKFRSATIAKQSIIKRLSDIFARTNPDLLKVKAASEGMARGERDHFATDRDGGHQRGLTRDGIPAKWCGLDYFRSAVNISRFWWCLGIYLYHKDGERADRNHQQTRMP